MSITNINIKHHIVVPTSIKIGYRTIVIEPRTMEDFGEFINHENKIIYNDKITPPELTNTILHELLHAIFQDRIVDLVGANKEETIVNALSNGLMTMFVENKFLLDFIKNNMVKESGT
jgi:Zn-dependent peptidase ImmA (M78 family)|tara:strand:- start:151 stop:504 length:354 start_codon:yes stop_codon:yes gene_type:complete